jgi:hypothetical protein
MFSILYTSNITYLQSTWSSSVGTQMYITLNTLILNSSKLRRIQNVRWAEKVVREQRNKSYTYSTSENTSFTKKSIKWKKWIYYKIRPTWWCFSLLIFDNIEPSVLCLCDGDVSLSGSLNLRSLSIVQYSGRTRHFGKLTCFHLQMKCCRVTYSDEPFKNSWSKSVPEISSF